MKNTEILKGWIVYTHDPNDYEEMQKDNYKFFNNPEECIEFIINEFEMNSEDLKNIKLGNIQEVTMENFPEWEVGFEEIDYILIDGDKYYPLKKLIPWCTNYVK